MKAKLQCSVSLVGWRACFSSFVLVVDRKDMTLKEAEVLALATLKQVMEEKVTLND